MYTNYYIAGVRDGKKTRVFNKNLHQGILAARKIGMKPTSKDAYGYDSKKKKWESLKTSAPVAATFRKDAAKSLLEKSKPVKRIKKDFKEVKQMTRGLTAKSLLEKGIKRTSDNAKAIIGVGAAILKGGQKILKKTNFIVPAVKLLGEKIKVAKSTIEANQARKDLLKKFSDDLPSTIMGADNYNKAVRTIDDYLKKGNYVAASNYMVTQLFKLENQTRGTGSNTYVADKLGNWYGKHLTFPEE